ncbi:MAG: diacylglycerol kinase family lipid kinase [Myxococcales bacterium]|nr:diacylglycerol kinase family lipid kinase [Myxococcales bacterium]
MSLRPLLIVNPKAGAGRAGEGLDGFLRVVEGALGPLDVAKTTAPRHAVDIAETAAREGREVVIATGGDGSIHEVANGLLRAREAGFTQAALGIIGRGTGGDLCRTLGLEHRLERYLSAIAARRPRSIDVGRFSYVSPEGERSTSYFVNILSAGLGGLVDSYVHRHSRWAGGKVGYFIASAEALIKSEIGVLKIRVEHEGKTREEEIVTRQIAICNGRYFGSGMFVAPMASVEDGVFEVVDLGKASKLKFAASGSAIYSGRHLQSPDVSHFSCQKISIEVLNERARSTFLLDVDGEPLGSPPLELEVVPKALPVLLPV